MPVKARRSGRWIAVAVTLAAITLAPAGSSAAESVRVTVQPVNALLDAPFRIRVTGLASRQRATLAVTEVGFDGRQLVASRPIQADRKGVVDLPRSGLLALVSLRHGSKDGVLPRFTRNVRVSVRVSGRRLADANAVRFVTSPSVTIVDQRPAKSGFYGEYFRPSATSSHTAIVLVGGSNGGLANGYAAGLLASHGYPVLALAYFDEPGLPPELQRIPLEYFQRAISWLADQPEADPKRITSWVFHGAERPPS